MEATDLPDGQTREFSITHDELLRCKRATVVLADVFKFANGGKQAPLALRQDMQTLTTVLRRMEAFAKD